MKTTYTLDSATIDVSSPQNGVDEDCTEHEKESPFYRKDFKPYRESITINGIIDSKKPDFEALLNEIFTLSRGQRRAVAKVYTESFDIGFLDHVAKVFKKKGCISAVRLLCQTYNEAYLELVQEAIKSKKQMDLVFLIYLRQTEAYDTLVDLYKKVYGKPLIEEVGKVLTGDMKTLCINYILAKDSESASMYDDPDEEAGKLTRNIKSKGLNELITLASRCTRDFLSTVLEKFFDLTEKPLLELYRTSSKNVVFDALQGICDLCKSEAYGIASYIHTNCEKDPSFVLSLLLVRSEVDMKDILREYESLTGGKSLPSVFQKMYRDEDSMVFTKLVAPYLMGSSED